MNHFSDMGFVVNKENYEEFIKRIVDQNKQYLQQTTIGEQDYLILLLDNVIEIWFHFEDGKINPYDVRIHYHTKTFLETETIEK